MSLNRALQRDLDAFFKKMDSSKYTLRQVTKGAFTQARAKLNPWAFQRLNEIAVKTFYDDAEYNVWHMMRVLAVDGTRLVLPNHPSVVEEFGQHSFGPKASSPRSLAIGSMLYDVLNQITLDAQIAPYTGSENDMLHQHLEKVEKGDMLLLDRGYPSIALLFLLKSKGIEFCMRLPGKTWKEARSLSESSDKERVVSFTLPRHDKSWMNDHPEWKNQKVQCRLVKVELPSGEQEILCTSLLDEEQYPHLHIAQLYQYRWNEEEAYKLLKNRIEIEDFSGKTARAVKQDFYAKVFLLTLCAAYAHPIEERVTKEYKADTNRKRSQKINRTNALAMTREVLVSMFLKKQYKRAFASFDDIVYKTREVVRPGRKEERVKRQKKRYSINYKRL